MSQQYRAKESGALIVATSDTLRASANILGITPDGEPEYAGESEIDWDSQETLTRDGKMLFLDEDGHEWTFDELEPVPDDEDEDEAEG